MKTLIVYYSRTGTTKTVAQALAKSLNADVEELIDLTDRLGPIGYLKAGREAIAKKLTKIKPVKNDSSNYDLVIVGTPVWASRMASAVRTYLTENKNFKKVAFFCTMGGGGDVKTFKGMEELSKRPVTTLTLLTKEVKSNKFSDKLNEFVKKIK